MEFEVQPATCAGTTRVEFLIMDRIEKDFTRPEGVYISSKMYPDSGQYSTRLFTIERVNGDCSVSRVILAQDEVSKVVAELSKEF